jgi:hypothetical protein
VPGSADAEIDMLQATIIMVVSIIIMMVITTTMMMMMVMAAFFGTRDTDGITQTSQTVVLGYFM